MFRQAYFFGNCRTLTGAWIEITKERGAIFIMTVAPSRVRGLKFKELKNGKENGKVAPSRVRGLK